MNKLLAGLMIAIAVVGCKSVPVEVRAAHDSASEAQSLSFLSIEKMMGEGVNNTQEAVDALRLEYEGSMTRALTQRAIVNKWLVEEDYGDALEGHKTLVKALRAIDGNQAMLFDNWTRLDQPGAAEFVTEMKRHLNGANDLLRRFDDWIKQFKTSGDQ